MDHRARFGFLQRGSYAPQLRVDIPAELARQNKCTVFTLIPLPPALLYDPFTARIERSEAVSDAQFLGHLELEKAVGWAGEGAYEDEVRRTWWERNDFQDPDLAPHAARLETCHGKACEHTALLLELDPPANTAQLDVHLNVPLHVRYHAAQARDADVPPADAPAAHDGSAWGRATHALAHAQHRWQQFTDSYLARWTQTQYEHVPLLANNAGPVVFASCSEPPDPMIWEETGTYPLLTYAAPAQLLHGEHAHLLTELSGALAMQTSPLYTPIAASYTDEPTSADVPIGNAALYPAVLLMTLLAVLFATRAVVKSVRHAASV